MVTVCCFDITRLQPGDYEKLYAMASQERRARADRYLKAEDRVRCVVAEALLWRIPGFSPEKLTKTPKGKPCFGDGGAVHFNLSHSGRWVVLAWGDSPVGIDVEEIRMNMDPIARQCFHQQEQEAVFSAPEQERSRAFFRIWTMKESYLKYLGTGIDRPLSSFSVLEELPGVILSSYFLPDACLTLCAQEPLPGVQMLKNREILPENRCL